MPASLEYARITPDARDFLRGYQNVDHLIGQKVPGMMRINEQGQRVFSFKHPESDEMIHLPHTVIKMEMKKESLEDRIFDSLKLKPADKPLPKKKKVKSPQNLKKAPEQYSPAFHDQLMARAKHPLHGKTFQNDMSAHHALHNAGAKYVTGSARMDSNSRLRSAQYRHPQHGAFNLDINRLDGTAKVNHIGSQGQMNLIQKNEVPEIRPRDPENFNEYSQGRGEYKSPLPKAPHPLHGQEFADPTEAMDALSRAGATPERPHPDHGEAMWGIADGQGRSNYPRMETTFKHPQHGTFQIEAPHPYTKGPTKISHLGFEDERPMNLIQMIKNLKTCKGCGQYHDPKTGCGMQKALPGWMKHNQQQAGQIYSPERKTVYHHLHGTTHPSWQGAHAALTAAGATYNPMGDKLKTLSNGKTMGYASYSHPQHGEFQLHVGGTGPEAKIAHVPSIESGLPKMPSIKMQKGGDPNEVAKWVNATHMKQPRQEQVSEMEKAEKGPNCECEHKVHFDNGGGHDYQSVPSAKPVITPYGHFNMCSQCIDEMHGKPSPNVQLKFPTKMEKADEHAHHWVLPPPAGKMSTGTCKTCGTTKDFPNYNPTGVWDHSKVPGRTFNRKTPKPVTKARPRQIDEDAEYEKARDWFIDNPPNDPMSPRSPYSAYAMGHAIKPSDTQLKPKEGDTTSQMKLSKMFPSWFNLVKGGKLDSKAKWLEEYHLKNANLSSLRKVDPDKQDPKKDKTPRLQRDS